MACSLGFHHPVAWLVIPLLLGCSNTQPPPRTPTDSKPPPPAGPVNNAPPALIYAPTHDAAAENESEEALPAHPPQDKRQQDYARALREAPSEAHRSLDTVAEDINAGQLERSRTRLGNMLATLQTTGSVDEVMTARALLGRAYARGGARSPASREYERVIALWEADKRLASVRGEGGARDLARIAHALSAVGEALFFQAEELRDHADALTLPPTPHSRYHPPAKPVQDMTSEEFQHEMERRAEETQMMTQFINSAVKGWIETKKARIEDAERAYAKITAIEPVPPPIWTVAGAARVGALWHDFAEDFKRTPMPKWLETDAELRRIYVNNLEQAAAPIEQRARAAFGMCEQTAEIYKVTSDHAQACQRWLAAHPDP